MSHSNPLSHGAGNTATKEREIWHKAEIEGKEVKKKKTEEEGEEKGDEKVEKNSSTVSILYPDSMKSRVVVEEFHLFCRKWPQNLLNGKKLETKKREISLKTPFILFLF